jgi:ribosome-binding factor A
MDERRTIRVSEAVRQELTEIIGFETDDPRLLAVEVVEAHVSPDGRHCNVRVAIRGGVPELHFDQDRNPDVESRIDFLLKRAKKSRGRNEN